MKLSISVKQTIYVFVISLFCCGISSVINVYLNIQKDRVEQAQSITRTVDLHRDTLSRAVYTLDEQQVHEILISIIRQPLIKRATFFDDFGDLLGDSLRSDTYPMSPYLQFSAYLAEIPAEQSFDIDVNSKGRYAKLTLYIDESLLANELAESVKINLETSVIFTLLLATILAMLSYIYISRPVMNIAQWVTDLSSNKSIFPLPYTKEDELGLLVKQFSKEWTSNKEVSHKLNEMLDSLKQGERFSRMLMENASDAMFLCHPDSQIYLVNNVAERLVGQSFNQIEAKSIAEFSLDYSSDEMEALFTKIIGQKVHSYDDTFRRTDDEKSVNVNLECRATHFEVDGETFVMINARDVTERVHTQMKIHELAYYDSLTHLANRSLFSQQIEELILDHQEQNQYGALFYFDLDQFKNINDSLGHLIGDLVLVEIASRTKSTFNTKTICGRIGGDEFVVGIPNLADNLEYAAEKAMKLSSELLASISQPLELKDVTLHTTASIGIVFFPNDDVDANELIRRADTAMYKSKSLGRNGVQFFKREMQYAAQHLLELEEGIHQALAEDHFEIWIQSQVNACNDVLRGEVLVRWNHPKLGLVMPNFFIPHAEETGLIIDIDKWVIEKSILHLTKWREGEALNEFDNLAINISPTFFLQVDFVSYVLDLLDKYNVPGDLIIIEITENLLLNNFELAKTKMLQLKARGISFSIDDFGTGYSSLRYLKELPIDELKIDRSFVVGLTDGSNTSPLIEVILSMAKNLDLEVIAEGVETRTQRDLLVDLGCQDHQGYYFGHPVPADRFIESQICRSI
ncbi:putative bifunctional diguanylate cyclase/phosphodiesterase [Vibrio sp. WJH972]